MALRITQKYGESVVTTLDSKARVTQQYGESVVTTLDSKARVTQQYVEVALQVFHSVITKPASEVTAYTVQLNGTSETFNPPALDGPNTELTIYFEYSTDETFSETETSTPFTISEIGDFFDSVVVEFTNFYYFRAVATDGVTTWYGRPKTFLATDYYHEDDLVSGEFDGLEVVGGVLQLSSSETSGNRVTIAYDLSSLEQISRSYVNWTSTVPEGTSLLIEARVSENSGTDWSIWEEISDESLVIGLYELTDLSSAVIQFRITMETDTVGVTPTLSFFELFIADGYLSPPIFVPPGGDHYSNQDITLYCPTEDSIIYYTLDGSDPIENGLIYTDEIFRIVDGLVIKAVSYIEEGSDPEEPYTYSPVITNTYNIIPFPESAYKLIHAYRFRNDDGTESTATWKEDENVDLEELANTSLRMRVGFSGQEDVGSQKLQLDYRIKRVDEGTFTDWRIVPGEEISS